MTPDDAQRIGRLETAVAKLEQRVDDLRGDVQGLTPLSLAVAKMEGAVERMQTDMSGFAIGIDEVRDLIATDKKQREDAQAQARRDARNNRSGLYVGLALVVLTMLANILVQIVMAA